MTTYYNSKYLISVLPVILTMVSSCGTNDSLLVAGKSLKTAMFPPSEPAISREHIANLPYAMITARVGKGQPAVLVLANSENGAQQWMATNAVSVVTENGRLVRTVGFPHDLREHQIFGVDPLADSPHRLDASVTYKKTLSLVQTENRSFLMDCSFSPIGREKIEISELIFETVKIKESCISGEGWRSSNTFWVDAYDGFVWQSQQQWDADYPALSLSVLKPEG